MYDLLLGSAFLTVPVSVHSFPVVLKRTWSPTDIGGNDFAPWNTLKLWHIFCLYSQSFFFTFWRSGHSGINFSGSIDVVVLILLPIRSLAGFAPVAWIGVLRYAISAKNTSSCFSMRLAILTALSAAPLAFYKLSYYCFHNFYRTCLMMEYHSGQLSHQKF